MDAEELGARIKKLREASGLRATDLAERIGLDATALSKIENGRRGVKSPELTQIALALGVSPLAILEPDTLVGRLAETTRRPRSTRRGREAYDQLIALTELHYVLKQNRFHSSADLAWLDPSASAKKVPELLATRARDKLELQHRGPDMFSSLAERIQQTLGIDLLVEPHPDDELLGAAIVDPEFPLLFVNGAQTRAQALFTLAHLLGHLLAFHNRGSMVLDYGHDLDASGDDEWFANMFASALLMPREEILDIIDASGQEFERSFLAMVARFGLGPDVVAYRLMTLSFISPEAFKELRSAALERVALDLGNPDYRAPLSALLVANSQARSVTPPPVVRPAMLINRATKAFHRGLIAATPLAHLRDVPVEVVLEEGQRVRGANSVASGISFNAGPVDSAERTYHDSPA